MVTEYKFDTGKLVLGIVSGGYLQYPILTGDVTWKTERKGSPGELTFTVIKDDKIAFHEGAEVKLEIDGKGVFLGRVFTKSRDKNHHIKVTAFDQLRYLKNKDTLAYAGWTCTTLIDFITKSYGLTVGSIANTGCEVGTTDNPRVEDNTTLFDMILNNLDETVYKTGQLYVLYDDCGKVTLKNIEDMKNGYVVTESAAENFDYQSTIDSDVYNTVKVYYEDAETGERTTYITKNTKRISQWGGILQYHEKVETEQQAYDVSSAVMNLYGNRNCSLTVKGLIGDASVRAGCLLPVDLNLGDAVGRVGHLLLAESVTHKWSNGHHSMDISFSGSVNEGNTSFNA